MSLFDTVLLDYDPNRPDETILATLKAVARKDASIGAYNYHVDNNTVDRVLYPGHIKGAMSYHAITMGSPYPDILPHQKTWRRAIEYADTFQKPIEDEIGIYAFLESLAKTGLFGSRAIIEYQPPIKERNTFSADAPSPTDEIKKSIGEMFRKKGIPVTDTSKQIFYILHTSLEMTSFGISSLAAMDPHSKGKTFLLAAPYFEPTIVFPYRHSYKPKIIDTNDTNFILTAEKLQQAIDEAGGPHNIGGLLLTSPNHITQQPMPREELQKIAEIIVRNNLHVICDELYDLRPNGLQSNEPPSLASLTVTIDGKEHRLHDYVFTVDGSSKRYNLQGRKGYPKAGVGTTGNAEWLETLETERTKLADLAKQAGLDASREDKSMLLIAYMLEHTPGSYFIDNAEHYRNVSQDIERLFEIMRLKYGLDEKDISFTRTPEYAFFQFVKLAPELAAKVGITNSEELQQYMMCYAGVLTAGEQGSGCNQIGVRINPAATMGMYPNGVTVATDGLERIFKMVSNIKKGHAPPYEEIKRHMDGVINEFISVQETRTAGAQQRRLLKEQRSYAVRSI